MEKGLGMLNRKEAALSLVKLKSLVKYNPDTGCFSRKRDFRGIKAGDNIGKLRVNGYICVNLVCERYYAHRLAFFYMTGRWPKEVDHINHDKTDNRWINLREASSQENSKNVPISIRNKSGVVGVTFAESSSKWFACCRADGKTKYLGIFSDKFEAICARMSANNKYGFHPNHGGLK